MKKILFKVPIVMFIVSCSFMMVLFLASSVHADEPDDGGSGGTSYDYSEDFSGYEDPVDTYVDADYNTDVHSGDVPGSDRPEDWEYNTNVLSGDVPGSNAPGSNGGAVNASNTASGEPITTEGPDGSKITWTQNPDGSMAGSDGSKAYYNSDGNLASVVYSDGSKELYDKNENLASVIDKDGTTWSYDKNGNPTGATWTDKDGTVWNYDKNGNETGATWTDKDGTTWNYDKNGNPINGTNANGNPIKLDSQGNVINSNGTSSGIRAPSGISTTGSVGKVAPGTNGGGGILGSIVSGISSLFGGSGTRGTYYGTGTTGGYSSLGGTTTGGYSSLGGTTTTGGYSSLGSLGSYSSGTSAGGWNPASYAGMGLPSGSLYGIARSMAMWALSIFGFLGIIGFVISGAWYLLAAGDDTIMKRAKNAMLYSIIGVVVGLIGLVIIYAADALLSGSSFL